MNTTGWSVSLFLSEPARVDRVTPAGLCVGSGFCLFRLTQEITVDGPMFSPWETMNVLRVVGQTRASSFRQQYQKCCVNVMLENGWSKFCFMWDLFFKRMWPNLKR